MIGTWIVNCLELLSCLLVFNIDCYSAAHSSRVFTSIQYLPELYCTLVYKGKGRQFGGKQGRAVKLPSKQVQADLKKISEDAAKMVGISLLYPHILMLHPRH